MNRLYALALLALLATSAMPGPAAAAACDGVRVEGAVASSSHAHYQPPAGTDVTLHVRNGAKSLDLPFPGAYDPQASPHYSLCAPSGAEGLAPGDRVHATLVHDGHVASSPSGANAATVGGAVLAMPTMQWANTPPALTVEVLPGGPTDSTALGARIIFTDAEGDVLGASLTWSWASCDPAEADCSAEAGFVGRPDLCQGAACEAAASSTSPHTITTGLVPPGDTDHVPGNIWRIQVLARDEHGALGLATGTRRIGIDTDIPDARLDVTVAGQALAPGAKLAAGGSGAAVVLDASASADRENAPVTPTSSLLYRFDADGDGTFGTASGTPTLAQTYASGRHVPAVQVEDSQGFAETAAAPPFFVNHVPAIAALALPTLQAGQPAAIDVASAVSDADNAAGDTVFPDDALSYDLDWEIAAPDCASGVQSLQPGSPGASPSSTLAAAPAEGRCVRLRTTVSDGYDSVQRTTTALVANSPPVVTSAVLAPATSTGPLQLTYATTDPDTADALECAVDWTLRAEAGTEPQVESGSFGTCTDSASRDTLVRGQVWSATVRVRDEAAVASLTSAEVTIANSAPRIGTPNLAGPANTTSTLAFTVDNVPGRGAPMHDQDGDALTCMATWWREAGASDVLLREAAAPSTACTESTLALPAGSAQKGNQVYASVAARETAGTATSAPAATGLLTIGNAKPAVASVALAAADGAPPTTGDVLRAQVTASDPDAVDQPGLTCQASFRKAGAAAASHTATGPCGSTATFDAPVALTRGDEWSVRATVTDADGATAAGTSSSLRVLNTPPVASQATLWPTAPQAGQTLAVRFTPVDADGDALTCEVDWWRSLDGATYTLARDGSAAPCSGTQNVTLASTIAKGEFWKVVVQADDGIAAADSAGVALDATLLVQVGNTLPTVSSLTLTPASPRTGDDLVAQATVADADLDTVSCTFRWILAGAVKATQQDVGCADGRLDADATTKGETWTVAVAPRDHANNPAGAEAQAAVTILNSAPAVDAGLDRQPPGGSLLSVNATATDADGDALTLSWTFVSGTPVTPLQPRPVEVQVALPLSGLFVLAFTASDGSTTATDEITIAIDDDNDDDGRANGSDNCLAHANGDQADADNDGAGDACDATPRGPDVDNDGRAALDDNCPSQANADQANLDGDALGDPCDADQDGDGVPDAADAFPRDAAESKDLDGDGLGDVADPDDDADGTADTLDNCPVLANAGQADLDRDRLGDACDGDRDGDGQANGGDAFPLDASETADNDADGQGDNADLDDDNDRVPDAKELLDGTDPRNPLASSLTPRHLHAVPDGNGGAMLSFAPAADPRVTEYLVFREASPIVLVARLPPGEESYLYHDPDAPETSFRYYVQARLPGEGLTYVLGPRSNNVTEDGPVLDCQQSPDTDGDGLCDAMEIAWGLNATNPDTDGDGRSDGDEALGRGGVYSLAWLADSDGDGRQDGDEVRDGSDPFDTSSVGARQLNPASWSLLALVVLGVAALAALALVKFRR